MNITAIDEPPAGREIDGRAIGWGFPTCLTVFAARRAVGQLSDLRDQRLPRLLQPGLHGPRRAGRRWCAGRLHAGPCPDQRRIRHAASPSAPCRDSRADGPAVCRLDDGEQQPLKPLKKKPEVPYVPTHEKVVAEMLKVAKVGKNDILYDLGSGDGRIVITAA